MRVALITDVHFGPRAWHAGKLRKLSDLAPPLLREFVRRMNEVDQPELVLNLGDVLEDENVASDRTAYEMFLDVMSGLRAPVLHVAGNHESVNLDDDTLRSLWRHEGPLYYSRDIGGVHFTVLRSLHWRAHEVRLPTEQLGWLAQDLGEARLPCVVLIHHPLAPMDLEGNHWFAKTPEICFVAERAEARGIIERSGKVIAVLNGHVHWNHLAVVAGIPYVTFQSLTENVDDDAPGRPARTYAVVDIEAHRLAIRVEGEQPARYEFPR
ncbi:MAG: metallophosphoesterase [Polyangiaceae bacterium]|nr:metallophosphoesterase [Polyangiaceae bacterium]